MLIPCFLSSLLCGPPKNTMVRRVVTRVVVLVVLACTVASASPPRKLLQSPSVIFEQRVQGGGTVYLDELLRPPTPQPQREQTVDGRVHVPLGGIGDTAREPFTSNVCQVLSLASTPHARPSEPKTTPCRFVLCATCAPIRHMLSAHPFDVRACYGSWQDFIEINLICIPWYVWLTVVVVVG